MNPSNRALRSAVARRIAGLLIVLIFASSLLACTKESNEQPETVEPKPVAPPPDMAAPVPPVPPPPAVAPEPQVASTEPQKAVEPLPPPPEPAKPVKQIAEPVAVDGKWTVQVGSFIQKDNASRMLRTLQSKGYQAYVIEAIVDGKTHHRLRVGRFASEQEARALEKNFESKEGFSDAFVVRQAAGQAARKKF